MLLSSQKVILAVCCAIPIIHLPASKNHFCVVCVGAGRGNWKFVFCKLFSLVYVQLWLLLLLLSLQQDNLPFMNTCAARGISHFIWMPFERVCFHFLPFFCLCQLVCLFASSLILLCSTSILASVSSFNPFVCSASYRVFGG